MRTLLKYAIFLALAIAIGFYVVYGPLGLEDIGRLPAQPEAADAPVDSAGSASTDEEADFLAAKRLGSPAGWRAFLAAHASGVHAESGRAAVEKLLPAEKAPSPPAADIPNGGSPNAKAASEAVGPAKPAPRTEVAALTPDEVCKRDEDRLAQLRSRPSIDEATRFANALGCKKLLPQLRDLVRNWGDAVPAPAAAEVLRGASPNMKTVSGTATAAPPSPRTEVAALTPDEVCKRDGDRLAQLRSRPSIDEAARFANAWGCEKLLPQFLDLMKSWGDAVPAPAAAEAMRGASPEIKTVSETVGPALPSPGREAAALTPEGVCKRDGDRLAQLRGSPSGEEAQRLARELGCEALRPQLQRLMESLGLVAAAPGNSSRPPDSLLAQVCASERVALDRLRKEPSPEAAGLFWRDLKCEGLRPQVRRLMESLNLTPESLGSPAAPPRAAARAGAASDAPTPDGADPAACGRETAELNRIRATPDLGDAKRFASAVTCDALKPQAARLLESLAE
jgi:hypothetical protein